ncbi:hypothetical protein [Rhizobium halophytocola]|uniref:Uncharacterized protein n=1 Tax=Rhizobium halophytocola TaxID=735519 RepID=A0ABS4DWP8_9HYPH|nr:hypothetical protein [Rhizobium halophytocola]MBP1850121.1 hypothetical protein [Rhizobium halophytocola]
MQPDELEIWALSRAEQIVLKEGMNLVHAGQWMDKQLTARSACRLRNEILRALMDALEFKDGGLAQAAAGERQAAEAANYNRAKASAAM